MGAIEFAVSNLNVIDKKFIKNVMPKDWNWCKCVFLYRANFSLVNDEIYVDTRDFSDELDDYFLEKEERKAFYIVPKDYDKTKHFSFSRIEATKEEFIKEYKKRKAKNYDKRNLCSNER